MTKLPLELKRNTILEAIFELRFEPDSPNEAVFGLIYPIVMRKFQDLKPLSLPILQMPEAVRNADSNFKWIMTN